MNLCLFQRFKMQPIVNESSDFTRYIADLAQKRRDTIFADLDAVMSEYNARKTRKASGVSRCSGEAGAKFASWLSWNKEQDPHVTALDCGKIFFLEQDIGKTRSNFSRLEKAIEDADELVELYLNCEISTLPVIIYDLLKFIDFGEAILENHRELNGTWIAKTVSMLIEFTIQEI